MINQMMLNMKRLIQFVNNSISEYIQKDPSLEFTMDEPPIYLSRNKYLHTKV
jgi:hypothetical protein